MIMLLPPMSEPKTEYCQNGRPIDGGGGPGRGAGVGCGLGEGVVVGLRVPAGPAAPRCEGRLIRAIVSSAF